MKIYSVLKLFRLDQWIKNLFLFAPLFFSFYFDVNLFKTLVLGAFIFSVAASSVYILNDYHDVEEDKLHPQKCTRPIASGEVPKKQAVLLMFLLSFTAMMGAWFLSFNFFLILFVYLLINCAYTFKFKHIAVLDISVIAFGFVLRIFAGASLINVSPSNWIVLVTFVLALFLALAKRRDDCLLALDGKKTRKNIAGYNLEMLNSALSLMAAVTILAYIMYTVSPEVISRLGTGNIYLTSFFVIIGVLRYMQLTFVYQNSGSPTKLVLKDKFLQIILLAWLYSFYVIIKVF